MKYWKLFFAAVVALLYIPAVFAATTPTGNWTTIDDKTGEKKAIVRINVDGDTLSGTIIKIYSKDADTKLCSKCPGDFKDKKILGLQFLWGMKKESDTEWSGGQILDPKTGKIYRAKITMKDNKLHVRGYLGFAMLGRTQVWEKAA